MFESIFMKIVGIVAILGGIYSGLLAWKVIPINPKDPKRSEEWHRKFGFLMKFLSPFLIIMGFLHVIGII
jgi:hypothetical protein